MWNIDESEDFDLDQAVLDPRSRIQLKRSPSAVLLGKLQQFYAAHPSVALRLLWWPKDDEPRFLLELPMLQSLTIDQYDGNERAPDLGLVARLPHLQHLRIESVGALDLAPLQKVQLHSLALRTGRATRLRPLAEHQTLAEIALHGTTKDCEVIASMPGLSRYEGPLPRGGFAQTRLLSARLHARGKRNLGWLAGWPELRSLGLTGVDADDWAPIRELRLHSFTLASNKAFDALALVENPHVRELSLSTLAGLPDLVGIDKFTKLRTLHLYDLLGIRNIDPLIGAHLHQLRTSGRFRRLDLSALPQLSQLKSIDIFGRGINKKHLSAVLRAMPRSVEINSMADY